MSVVKLGKVASLHLHPVKSAAKMLTVDSINLVAGKGIEGDHRHFGKLTKSSKISPRDVSIIDRHLLDYHAKFICDEKVFVLGIVRSNIPVKGDKY